MKRWLFFLPLCVGWGAVFHLHADTIPGAPPSESVLLIYTDVTAYNVQLKDAFRAALLAAGATVTEVRISAGDGGSPGFYNELVAQTGKTNLLSWCQVYDLRFRDDRNNVGWTGQNQEDVITFIGTNTDTQLFTQFLQAGGSLFLQGEHHDYYIRNTNLLMFINQVATAPINQQFVDVFFGASTASNFSATPENFSTDYNDLNGGVLNTNFMGGIALGNRGSGQPLVTWQNGAVTEAMVLAWLPQNLQIGSGRLVVSFESNAFAEPTLQNATSQAFIQNVYDLLSGCLRYELTKTFSQAEVCVGDTSTFTLCYQNTGTRSLPAMTLVDTLPSCFTFVSSTPPPSGGTGQVRFWNIGTVPSGASACVTVQYTVSSFNCP